MFNIQINITAQIHFKTRTDVHHMVNDIEMTLKVHIFNQIIVYLYEIRKEKVNESLEVLKNKKYVCSPLKRKHEIECTSHITRFMEQLTSELEKEIVKKYVACTI